jgi:hypothetical protein
MQANSTITVNISLDPKATKKGTIMNIPSAVVDAAKQTLLDGEQRVIFQPQAATYFIVIPRNPWVTTSKHYDTCEDVTVYHVMRFRGYSFPKGSLIEQIDQKDIEHG